MGFSSNLKETYKTASNKTFSGNLSKCIGTYQLLKFQVTLIICELRAVNKIHILKILLKYDSEYHIVATSQNTRIICWV